MKPTALIEVLDLNMMVKTYAAAGAEIDFVHAAQCLANPLSALGTFDE